MVTSAIVGFIVLAAVCGLLAWLAIRFIPMPAPVQQVIIIGVVVLVVLYLLHLIFGGGAVRLP